MDREQPKAVPRSKLDFPYMPYFILMGACFAATACCFFWFAAFALSCFCAACLCTAFGDLSPIISLPFGCWFTDPRDVRFSESDWNREVRRGGCQIANVSSQDFQLAVRPGFEPG